MSTDITEEYVVMRDCLSEARAKNEISDGEWYIARLLLSIIVQLNGLNNKLGEE